MSAVDTLVDLVDPNEKRSFLFVVLISILFWLFVIVAVIGIFWVLTFMLLGWFAQGLLVAAFALRGRSEGRPDAGLSSHFREV